MADVAITGRVAHVNRRQYDFVDDKDGRRVHRDGSDVYVVGQVLDDTPTVVQVEDAADIALLERSGQFSAVSIVCTTKKGKFIAGPGLITVLEGANEPATASGSKG